MMQRMHAVSRGVARPVDVGGRRQRAMDVTAAAEQYVCLASERFAVPELLLRPSLAGVWSCDVM